MWTFGDGVTTSGDYVTHTFVMQAGANLQHNELVTLTVVHEGGTLSVSHIVPLLKHHIYLPLALHP
jgi:hypothetical protein